MAEFCTCGAELPPDALFCHKCGKPQREEHAREISPEQQPAAPVAPAAPALPPEIGFHNRFAVRAAFLAATLASLLISFPMPVFLTLLWLFLWLLFAGCFAVYFYRRRTGFPLSVRGGVRMGWITGIFCFVIAMVFFTVSVISLARSGGLAAFYRQQFTGKVPAGVDLNQMLAVLENPAGLAAVIFFALVLLFIIFTLVPTIGGALGAKLLDKKH